MMGYVAVLVAGAAGFGVGAIWYMTLAKPWMAAIGKTEEQIKADDSPLPYIIALLAAVVTAGMMRHIFVASGITDPLRCLGYGAGIGAFLAMPWVIMHYAFQGAKRSLWWIDGGHTVAAFAAIGLVLGLFL